MSTSLIVLLAGVVVLVVVVAILVQISDKGVAEGQQKMWSEVAARRGGHYRPGVFKGGGWETPNVIDVAVNGARIYVDTFHKGEAVNTEVYTQVRAEYVTGGGPTFEIAVPALVGAGPRAALGGNPAFDEGFVIRTDAPGPVGAVWTQAARDRMLRYFRGARTRVRCDGRVITMAWQGDERSAETLEAAIDIVADLAQAGRGAHRPM